jgi:citrate lyase subunit beta/citryl-CoA lyase
VNDAPARLRSLLFAPASRPDVVAKLPRSGPDGVVIDLEDAVPADGKADARVHARDLGEQLATEHPDLAVYVRVNAVASEWFARDVADGLCSALTGVVVPKLETAAQVATVAKALEARGSGTMHVVAGIETAAGVAHVEEVLRPPVAVAYFGAEDFVADMGGRRTESNIEVLYARSRVALAARLTGVHALDQIVAHLGDRHRFVADAREGQAIGYRGKLCIHPEQVLLANEVFAPSSDEVDHARRLLAIYEAAKQAGEAAIVFDGQMVDEPMARRARAIVEAAGGSAGAAS